METNDLGELITPEDVDDQSIEDRSFTETIAGGGSVTVEPEFDKEEMTTGRFKITYSHPDTGNTIFHMNYDEHCCWEAAGAPDFIKQDLIESLGDKIDKHYL